MILGSYQFSIDVTETTEYPSWDTVRAVHGLKRAIVNLQHSYRLVHQRVSLVVVSSPKSTFL